MASEEIVVNETLSGRLYKPPQYLTLSREGRLKIPAGSFLDFSEAATMSLPGVILTTIKDNVLAEIPNPLDGNIVHENTGSTATDAVNSMVLASQNSDITGTLGLNNALYDSVTSSNISSVEGNARYSDVSGSTDCHVYGNNATSHTEHNSIDSSSGCNITKTGTVLNRTKITASLGSDIANTGTAGISYAMIGASQSSDINGGTNAVVMGDSSCTMTGIWNQSGIYSSTSSNLTNTGTASGANASNDVIIGSTTCAITIPGAFAVSRNGIMACATCNITGTATVQVEGMIGSSFLCNLDGASFAAIEGSRECNMTSGAPGGTGIQHSFIGGSTASNITVDPANTGITQQLAMTACNGCNITNGATSNRIQSVSMNGAYLCDVTALSQWSRFLAFDGCQSCTADGTRNTLLGGLGSGSITNSIRTALLAGSGGVLSNASNVLAAGVNPNVTGFSNCFAFSGTSTASNQATLGVTTRITGTGNDLAVEGGYVQAAYGVVTPVRTSAVNTTLAIGDSIIYLNGGNLTLPLASTFGANYPLDTVITFKAVRNSTTTGTITTTAPDVFNQMTGFNSLTALNQRNIVLSLVNTTTTPHWRIETPIRAIGMVAEPSIDNTFGGSAKSDANQLPLSSSKATHEAVGSNGYVFFDGFALNYSLITSPFFTQVNPPPPSSNAGLTVNVTAAYLVSYGFDIVTATGAGSFVIRSDVIAGSPVVLSYAETGGNNARDGTTTVQRHGILVGITAGTPVILRLSQDSTNPISSTAHIRRPWLRLEAVF